MPSVQPPAVRSSLDVALWFQARSDSADERLPPRKFHYLLYLAQALYAADHDGQKLIPATFLAAESGPIEPNVYQLFENGPPLRKLADISRPVEEFLHEVWGRFGTLPMKEIESFVVRDGVWATCLKAGRNSEIPIERMLAGYNGSRALGSTPEREAARRRRNPGKEYWTPAGKRAKPWIPGVSGRNGGPGGDGKKQSAGARIMKNPAGRAGAGVKGILSPEEARKMSRGDETAKPRRIARMDSQPAPESKSHPRGTG